MPCTVYSTIKRPGMSKARIQATVGAVLIHLAKEHREVSVHCVGERRMQSLNRMYRGVEAPTDVLSFPLDAPLLGVEDVDAGDIFVCPAYVRKQAARFAVSFQEEMSRMIIHATLHLFGYDHAQPREASTMFALQEEILSTYLNT